MAARKYRWATASDEELLSMRFRDLKLVLSRTTVQPRIDRLYGELGQRGIKFKPHCWLAEEWFSPDGVPGIAIPFYLAHRRLSQLENRQMFGVEGGTDKFCMQLLRHEAGHAIDTAYGLHRRQRWQQMFGRFQKPYPDYYSPRPQSKNFVLHLDWWYAQSHPAEDFAETFAVWLAPGSRWQREYAGWGALKKLQYVDELMASLTDRSPLVRKRVHIEPLSQNNRTLGEHYAEKRKHYAIQLPQFYDTELCRLFTHDWDGNGSRRTAAAFLRRNAGLLCDVCARSTGEYPYVFAQILQEMIIRCRELKLHLSETEEQTRLGVVAFLIVHMLNHINQTQHRVPV
ncbi:MAG: hypothetical protein H6978_01500 [Gammaproteobacteria bacterium]|nr:hypothetical protein [Gammaproteobacteria bacterium]